MHPKVANSRACGEIGRRARLRIWCFATCRFESYHAHDWTKEEFPRKEIPLFLSWKSTTRAAKGHAKHRASGAAWVAKNECCQFSFHSLLFFLKSTTAAATGRRQRGKVTPCGMRQDDVVNFRKNFPLFYCIDINRQCWQLQVVRCITP